MGYLRVLLGVYVLVGLLFGVPHGLADIGVDVGNPPPQIAETTLLKFLRHRDTKDTPAPYARLIEELKYDNYSPITQDVPHGRSAQSASTDYEHPRQIAAPFSANKIKERPSLGFEDYSAFPGTDYEGKLFFGYAEREGKLEIFSWNPRTGHHDKLEVRDYYPNAKPKLFWVNDERRCNECHQGGAPIVTPKPWSEMISHDPLHCSNISEAQPKVFSKSPILFANKGTLLSLSQTPEVNDVALAYTHAVFSANRLLQASTVIRTLCGTNHECRRFILIAAMERLRQSDYIRKNIGKGANSEKDPTDLDGLSPIKALETLLAGKAPVEPFIPDYLKKEFERVKIQNMWPNGDFAYIDELIPDPKQVGTNGITDADLDPRLRRGRKGSIPSKLALPYLVDIACDALDLSLEQLDELKAIPTGSRVRALSDPRNNPHISELLTHWPPSPEQILSFYANVGLREASSKSDPRTSASETPSSPRVDRKLVEGMFSRYCVSCHDGTHRPAPYFPFEAIDKLLNHEDARELSIEQLEANTMPKRGKRKGLPIPQPTEKERSQMIAFLKERPQETTGRNSRAYLNNLKVRVLNDDEEYFSYIVPSPGVKIVTNTALTAPCGSPVSVGPDDSHFPIVGTGNDGRRYWALENFPHYFPGNIIQIFSAYSSDAPKNACSQIALSRRGKLFLLAIDPKRKLKGSIPLTTETDIAFTFISANPDKAGSPILGIGIDPKDATKRNIYLITDLIFSKDKNNAVDGKGRSYKTQLISLEGALPLGHWIRIVQDFVENRVYGETVQGEIVKMKLDAYNHKLIVEDRKSTIPENLFESFSLLDRSSVLLIPGKYHPVKKIIP